MILCPPKGTNTALHFDLIKAQDAWDEGTKNKLMTAAMSIFLVDDHMKYANFVQPFYSTEQVNDWYTGRIKMTFPKAGAMVYEHSATSGKFRITQEELPFSPDGWSIEYNILTPEAKPSDSADKFMELHLDADVLGELRLQPKRQKIPVDAVEEIEHLWKLQRSKSWENSNRRCQENGGQLLSVHSLKENENIFKFDEDYDGWIGATKLNESSSWVWSDTSHFNFSNWYSEREASKTGCGYLRISDQV